MQEGIWFLLVLLISFLCREITFKHFHQFCYYFWHPEGSKTFVVFHFLIQYFVEELITIIRETENLQDLHQSKQSKILFTIVLDLVAIKPN